MKKINFNYIFVTALGALAVFWACSQNISVDCGGSKANTPACQATSTAAATRNIPGAVTGIVATVGVGQVIISWQPSSDALSYKIKRGTKSRTYTETYDNVVSPFVITGLEAGSYFFVIIAVNASGSLDSSEFTATVVHSTTTVATLSTTTTSTSTNSNQNTTLTAPVLTATPTSQSIQQLFAATPVVISPTVADSSLSYSCLYTTGNIANIDTSGTNCLSLPSFNVAFNITTGVLDWTPSEAATTASTNTIYSFKITGSNSQNASGFVTYTITVLPGLNLNTISDRSFINSTPLVQGSPFSASYINLSSGDNTGLSYTCTFTTPSQASTNCTSLPDSASFGAGTGQLDWTPSTSAHGTYTITITGTKGSLVDTRTLIIQVQDNYLTNQLILNYDSYFSDDTDISSNSPVVSTWKNIGPVNGANASLNGFAYTNTDGWSGNGTRDISSGADGPYRLSFNGSSDSMVASNGISSPSNISFDTWIRPSSSSIAGSVIFSNAETSSPGTVSEANKGFTLKQMSTRYTNAGQVQLGLGLNSYVDEVFASNPNVFLRLDETGGNIFYDTATNNTHFASINSGTVTFNQNGAIPGDANAAISLSGSAVQIPIASYNLSNSGDFTISFWVKNTTQTAGGDLRPILAIHDSSNLLTNGINISAVPSDSGNPGQLHVGLGAQTFSPSVSLNDGNWHQITVVRNSTTYTVYHNGTAVDGTTGALSFDVASSAIYIGGSPLDDGAGTRYFKGMIDELAIYNHGLTATEVSNQYNASQKRLSCNSISPLTDNTWHHVAGSFDSTGPTLNLFVDGIQQCSQTLSGASYTGSSSQLSFGTSPLNSNYWAGALAQFRAYNTVLSASEIETNRQATLQNFAIGDVMPVLNTLKFWLVADDIGGTSDGTTLSRWIDRSGNNFHEYQNTASYRPVLKLAGNGINNHAVVRFDGVNDVMTAVYSGSITAKTMIVVTRLATLTPTGTAGGGGVLSLEKASSPNDFDSITYNELTAKRWIQGSGGFTRAIISPTDETSLAGLLMTYTSDTNDYKLYRKGSLLASSTSFSPPTFTNANFTVGMRHYISGPVVPGSNNHNYNGDLAEALIFTSVLTTIEQQAVESYLQAKYNL